MWLFDHQIVHAVESAVLGASLDRLAQAIVACPLLFLSSHAIRMHKSVNGECQKADKQTCAIGDLGGHMSKIGSLKGAFRSRRLVARVVQGMALALVFALVLSAAAEDRAVKSKVAPIYPEIAKRMRASGTVSIEATVDASGNVTDAKAVDGNRLLAPAAEDAVRKWKFESGASVTKVKVEINFAM